MADSHGALIARIERVSPAARELQLARDRDDLIAMQMEEFAGKTWHRKQIELYNYGRRVLPKKIRTGEIFAIMREVGVPPASDLRLPRGVELTSHEVEELVTDVSAKALLDFKRVLTAGVWDPYRDEVACMSTFYVGKCALEFRGPWRRFLRARRKRLEAEKPYGLGDELPASPDRHARPEIAAIARLEARRALDSIEDPLLQSAVLLDAYETPDKEIAERLGLTVKQVEYRLKKARRGLKNLRGVADDVA
ncbi:MAG: hypothetical protein KY395_03980 [Actinobacteria bacterium]|nr:hypothetical protein [Actinomycetota bacterium]